MKADEKPSKKTALYGTLLDRNCTGWHIAVKSSEMVNQNYKGDKVDASSFRWRRALADNKSVATRVSSQLGVDRTLSSRLPTMFCTCIDILPAGTFHVWSLPAGSVTREWWKGERTIASGCTSCITVSKGMRETWPNSRRNNYEECCIDCQRCMARELLRYQKHLDTQKCADDVADVSI